MVVCNTSILVWATVVRTCVSISVIAQGATVCLQLLKPWLLLYIGTTLITSKLTTIMSRKHTWNHVRGISYDKLVTESVVSGINESVTWAEDSHVSLCSCKNNWLWSRAVPGTAVCIRSVVSTSRARGTNHRLTGTDRTHKPIKLKRNRTLVTIQTTLKTSSELKTKIKPNVWFKIYIKIKSNKSRCLHNG